MTLDFIVPIRLGRGLNDRVSHWSRMHRVEKEREAVWAAWPRPQGVPARPKPPLRVHLIRVSPGVAVMDDDNLAGSCKGVRDEVARQLKLDDGDTKQIRFTYGQESGRWGCRVRVEEVGDEP